MVRRDLVNRLLFPNKGGYYQGFIESNEDSDDYGTIIGYGEKEDFTFTYVENEDLEQFQDRIKRDISTVTIETTADLPFKVGDRIKLNDNDVVNTLDEIKTLRKVNSIKYRAADSYNRLKAKYPNKHQDLRIKTIVLV